MNIVDLDDESELELDEDVIKLIPKKRAISCSISIIWRITAVLTTILVLISIVFFLRYYMKFLLLWLEHQQGYIQTITIFFLFCLVALPISIGYLILVCTSGYLYGFFTGLPLVIFSANFGILIANFLLKKLGHHPSLLKLTENQTAQAIKRLISGPSCFKIVLCARVTPIPFGLQNTIFAFSNVNPRVYHLASCLGLFPTQMLGVYLGTTLRAMQDAWEHNNFSTSAYIIITVQLVMDSLMMVWVGYKARKELVKVLADAENITTTGPIIIIK